MPPKSRIRPRGPVHRPTSEIIVTQKHSYELVRTVMTATISQVLWARQVFPHVKYPYRTFDPANPEVSYDVFMAGSQNNPPSFDPTDDLHVWKVMPRSQDPAIDKLLDCLENGAADALKKGYLSKLQLSFHSMDDTPPSESNMIESYTMIFIYKNSQDISVSTEIVSNVAILRSVKDQLYDLVNDVGFLIVNTNKHRLIQKLPEKFRMIMSLKYHEHTPLDYQPPKFREGNENTIQMLALGVPDDRFTMDTGFHSVSVGINVSEIEGATLSSQSRTRIRSQRQRAVSASSDFDGAHTQSDALRQIQTIGTFRDPNSGTQDTILRQRTQSIPDVETNTFPERSGVLEYTQQILDRIHAAKVLAPLNDFDLDEQTTQTELNCECCAAGDNENLVQCVICRDYKHATCYGYVRDDFPEDMVCYTCLLSADDPERLEMTMKPLCIKRRALWYLREKGSLSAKSQDDGFAIHLNIAPKLAAQLLNELKAEGYIKSHRRGKKTSSVPVYTYIGDPESLQHNFFRPQQGIDHLFTIPELRTADVPEPDLKDDLSSNGRESTVTASPDLYGASPVLSRKRFTEPMEAMPSVPVTPLPRSRRYAPEGISTPEMLTPQQKMKLVPSAMRKLAAMNSMNTDRVEPLKHHDIFPGNKRPAGEDEVGIPSKRHKVGEVSPWIIHRQET